MSFLIFPKMNLAFEGEVDFLWWHLTRFGQTMGDDSLLPVEEIEYPVMYPLPGNSQFIDAISQVIR